MGRLANAFVDLFYATLSVTFIGGGILLLAGEVRLATLKKLRQGSPKLSTFTERMTGEKLSF